MTDDLVNDDQRQEFLEHRASGIGATDSPKILGLSRHGTSLSVWNDKQGGAPDKGMGLPAWLGLKMQSTVGELYTGATGNRLRADNRHHRSKAHDFIVCHLDFRAWGHPDLLVECKTRAYMKGWGDDGTAEIPADVWVQVQHEMYVTGAKEAHVAVLFGHHTFRVYVVPRDDGFIERLVEKLVEWWNTYYLPGVPPPPTGHEIDTAAMKARHPDHDETLVPATPEHEALAGRLKMAVQNADQAAKAAEEYRNQFRDLIGDNAGIVGAFGTITWKRSKDYDSTDWEQVAITYGNIIEDLLGRANPGDDEAAVRHLQIAQATYESALHLFTERKAGSRRFVMNFKEGT